MRFNVKTTTVALTLATAGVVMITAPRLRAAAAPATAAPATPVRLDDDNAKRVAEIPNLRKARQNLYDTAKMLSNDVVDPKGYRHESIDYINKAIADLTNEINEYKGDEPPAVKK